MNKLSLGNLIGSGVTGVLWVFTLLLSSVGVSTRNRGLVMIGGLFVILLWLVNFAGVVLGLVTGLQNKKDWKAWLSLSLHVVQLGFASLLFVLGSMAQHRQTHFIE